MNKKFNFSFINNLKKEFFVFSVKKKIQFLFLFILIYRPTYRERYTIDYIISNFIFDAIYKAIQYFQGKPCGNYHFPIWIILCAFFLLVGLLLNELNFLILWFCTHFFRKSVFYAIFSVLFVVHLNLFWTVVFVKMWFNLCVKMIINFPALFKSHWFFLFRFKTSD